MVALNFRAFLGRRNDRGAELIELALVLPILLLVIAAIVDFGFLFQRWEVVTNAAREGARVAILSDFDETAVQTRVAQYMAASGLSDAPAATVVYEDEDIDGLTIPVAKVTVTYPSQFSFLGPIAGLVGGGGFTSLTLRATSVMRREGG